jgi:methyl-accepting chemotaxis protein
MKDIRTIVDAYENTLSSLKRRTVKAQLVRFQAEFERTFLSLVTSITKIYEDVISLRDKIETFRTAEKAKLIAVAVSKTEEIIREYKSEIRDVIEQNALLQQSIQELKPAVGAVSLELKNIDRASSSINLASINSSIVALGAGKEGLPFSVLAKDLRQVVNSNLDVVHHIGDLFNSIHEKTDSIIEMNTVLDRIVQAKSGLSLDQPAAEILTAVQETYLNLDQVVDKIVRVIESIGHVMVVIQRQDILRQGIEHVSQALESLEQEYFRVKQEIRDTGTDLCKFVSNYIVFRGRIGHLSAALLEDCKTDLEQLHRETTDAINTLYGSIDILCSTRTNQRAQLAAKLAAPAAVLDKATQDIEEFIRVSGSCKHASIVINDSLEAISKEVERIELIKAQININELMMRIEIARTGTLRNAGSVMDDIHQLIEQLSGYTVSTKRSMLSLEQPARDIKRRIAKLESSFADFANTNAVLREHPKAILFASQEFMTKLETIIEEGERIKRATRAAEIELNKFSDTIQSLNSCAEFGRSLAESSSMLKNETIAYGYFVDVDEHSSKKMEELLERFTTLTHKRIGGEIGNVKVGDGDAEGTVTLF